MATGVGSAADSFAGEKQHSMRFIVAASGAGTVIEWYDFYIFGSLATLMAVKFFHAADTGAVLLTLRSVAAGGAPAAPRDARARPGCRPGRILEPGPPLFLRYG